jgi:hypothetical protein
LTEIGDKGIFRTVNGKPVFVPARRPAVGEKCLLYPVNGDYVAIPLDLPVVGETCLLEPVSGGYLALRLDGAPVPKLAYSFAEHGSSVAYGGVDYVRVSLDSGTTWSEIAIPGTVKELGFNSLGVLAISLSTSANMYSIDPTKRVLAGWGPRLSCTQVGSGVYSDSRFESFLFSYSHCCPTVPGYYNYPGYGVSDYRVTPDYGLMWQNGSEPTMIALSSYVRAEGTIAGAFQDAEAGSGLPTPIRIFYSSEGVYKNKNGAGQDNLYTKISTYSFKKMVNIGSGRVFGLHYDTEFGHWDLCESASYGAPPYNSHLLGGTTDTAVWACYNRTLNEIAVMINRGAPSNDVMIRYYPALGDPYDKVVPNSTGATGTALCLTDAADAWVGLLKNGVPSVQKIALPRR